MLEVLLFVGSLLAALLMGAAMLAAVAGDRKWRAFAKPDDTGVRALDTSAAAFEPLEMAPFTLKWPSEIERPTTKIPEPPWPSENWDDAYFGVRSREDVRRVRAESVRLEEKRDSAYRHEALRQREHQAQSRQDRGEQAEQRRQAQQERREADAQRKQERARTPEQQFFDAGSPTPEDIAALVRQHGLAGAVDQIRARTGWDFKQAAQYLAQTLRDRK